MEVKDIAKKKGTQIRIGTAGGSNFIYIGEVTDKFEEDMKKLDEVWEKKYTELLEKAKKSLTQEVEYWEGYLANILPKTKEGLEKSESLGTIPEVGSIKPFVRCSAFYNKTLRNLHYIKDKPMLSRKVIESYPSLLGETVIYIIEGNETGYAWDESEWKGIEKNLLEEDDDGTLLE